MFASQYHRSAKRDPQVPSYMIGTRIGQIYGLLVYCSQLPA
jgi:hypothetical protein